MEKEQKRLYLHFKNMAVNGKDDIQRENCKGYAAEILKSFPMFEVKEKPKEIPKEKPKEVKRKK